MSAWPNFAKPRQRTVQVVAHSRGVTPAAGFLEYELGRGARIVARVSVVPMVRQTAFAFRAWVHSLRGRGAFLFPLAKAGAADSTSTIYTDGTRFSDATPYADLTITTLSAGAAEGASALTVTGAHTAFVVGGFVRVAGQTVRVVSVADAGGGSATLGIRPRLRAAASAGATVEFDNVYCEMRLSGPVPQVPIVLGNHSAGFDVDLEEAY